jgi:hypothetical protein
VVFSSTIEKGFGNCANFGDVKVGGSFSPVWQGESDSVIRMRLQNLVKFREIHDG